MTSFVEKYSIDIIESPDWLFDIWAYMRRYKTPICIRLHGYFKIQRKNTGLPFKRRIKDVFIQSFLKDQIMKASIVSSVSDGYARVVRNAYKIKHTDIKKIPIGINFSIFYPKSVEHQEQSVLMVGRMEKAKGLEVLNTSIPLILKDFPRMKFYFAGPDFKRNTLGESWSEYLIRLYGKGTIVYLGQLSIEELGKYFQKVSVFVSPSLFEAGGMVAIEAMACNCPVIATQTEGSLENIKDNENGLLVPVGNSKSLVEAIFRIFKEKGLKERLTRNALSLVQKNFDIEQIAGGKPLKAYADTIENFKQRDGKIAA